MFSKHLLKVIIGFCGMIIFGLVSLVIVDSFKEENKSQMVTPAPVIEKVNSPVQTPAVPAQKAPANKTTPR